MKGLIKKILSKLGLTLLSNYDQERSQEYIRILELFAQQNKKSGSNDCAIIIFSKDRAMQLDALLRSYFHYTINTVPVHVLYNVSSEEFNKAYKILTAIYKEKNVFFHQEESFKQDLNMLFDTINTSKVLFLVDDLFFKKHLDFEHFQSIDTHKYIASLRMGKHLDFSYTLQLQQKLPQFLDSVEYTDGLVWDFQTSELDWAYPLSVDGHVFDANEMRVLVKELNYKAPNSFEEALQLMKPLYSKRKGLCYQESIIVNNPCNKVQVENDNLAGEVTIEDLNEKWLDGYRINFEQFEGLQNESAHQELVYSFMKRK